MPQEKKNNKIYILTQLKILQLIRTKIRYYYRHSHWQQIKLDILKIAYVFRPLRNFCRPSSPQTAAINHRHTKQGGTTRSPRGREPLGSGSVFSLHQVKSLKSLSTNLTHLLKLVNGFSLHQISLSSLSPLNSLTCSSLRGLRRGDDDEAACGGGPPSGGLGGPAPPMAAC